MTKKKVVLVIASSGYQPIEYSGTREELENAGLRVLTASDTFGEAIATDNSTTRIDVQLVSLKISDIDGIFFIGGAGALSCLDNQTSHQILKEAQKARKSLGAICISSRILARAGVLKEKKATGWDGDGKLAGIFKEHGVIYEKKNVVTDGTIITATGPSVAHDFGLAIVRVMTKE